MSDHTTEARRLLHRAHDILTGPDGALVWHTMEGLVAEVERLRRVLAVEAGDESAAPPGWHTKSDRVVTIWYRGPWSVYRHRSGVWRVFRAGSSGWISEHKTALEAMEAADRAGGSDV